MAINTGSTNYPNDYDLNPISGTPTLSYVSDEVRNNITGIIVESGTVIRGIQINPAYKSIQAIEETLGINPEGYYNSVAERLDNIVAGSGIFVHVSGDTMYGPLTMGSGVSILPEVSGASDLGSASKPFGTIYVNNIIPAPSGGAVGDFVHRSGDSMFGNLIMDSWAGIASSGSTISSSGSMAFGLNNDAVGFYSQAFGWNTDAMALNPMQKEMLILFIPIRHTLKE
jgi:hypothetical protein